ncbi:MAG: acetate--CoA ligase family protein [Planctomycetes bacterium]|nr:acetate--CoA ligase family protein [Planctomycetota bacterium]
MIKDLFQPSSIAVIGASREPGKLGHTTLKNIITSGYKGRIYPVNKNADEILGLKCYQDVQSVPGDIDLIIFSVPAPFVLPILKSAVESKKNLKSAIIITAGFKEIGLEGARMEKEIRQVFKDNDIRAIGPNGVGFIDLVTPLNATFLPADKLPPRGQITFFSQSGGLCMAILDWTIQEQIGISKLISLGNKIDVDEIDLIDYLAADKDTNVILGYLEAIENGRRFMEVARRVSKIKPIVMVKGGSSVAGSRAASSHTGSLAGQDRAYQAGFLQSGVIRVDTLPELFDVARAFATYSGSPDTSKDISLKGPRIAIITNAGGPAVMATDQIEKSKILQMAQFTEETIAKLRAGFPPGANFYNPIDVIADATYERYSLALESAHNDKNVDGLLAVLLPASKEKQPEAIARAIVEMFRKSRKPILACFMGGEIASRGVELIKQAGIPCYPYPEQAITAFKAMFQYSSWQNSEQRASGVERIAKISKGSKPYTLCAKTLSSGETITTDEVMKVINDYDIPIPDFKLAQSLDQALEYAEAIGYPVVLKLISAEFSHKTDVGGVKLNIHTPAELNKAYREIIESVSRLSASAAIKGIMVQKMVAGGQEIIIGVSRDRQFGHLIMFGLGGIYVEVLKDVSFRLAPLKMSDVEAMIREIKTYPLLKGIRGQEPSDLQNLKETILKISQLVTDFPQIAELDINPYKLFSKGGIAIDARITIA